MIFITRCKIFFIDISHCDACFVQRAFIIAILRYKYFEMIKTNETRSKKKKKGKKREIKNKAQSKFWCKIPSPRFERARACENSRNHFFKNQNVSRRVQNRSIWFD